MSKLPFFELFLSVGNHKPKLKWFFEPKTQAEIFQLNCAPGAEGESLQHVGAQGDAPVEVYLVDSEAVCFSIPYRKGTLNFGSKGSNWIGYEDIISYHDIHDTVCRYTGKYVG